MKHSEIRRSFLAFYAERGHTIVPSASLIPRDDPTLLFTSAGMVQFKPLFAGSQPLPYRRATSIQKCLRGSDLPEVGKSIKHLTFFEMLGNFSFGDYFKPEGIEWAWEYLTQVVRLEPDALSVSVFSEDQEAFEIWRKSIGLPESRIFRLGAKDNFWGPAGGIGACGPCSEIYYDLGPEFGCGAKTCAPGCDCPRFTEIYNVVFPQYDQQADGTRLPLKNRGIDTGMGMERLAMVSQHVRSVFETDLFIPLLKVLGNIIDQELSDAKRSFFNAACDHARALTFAIADGAIPSNEARGYMLRSILRRALIMAQRYQIQQPFLYRLSGEVTELMRHWYPELVPKREQAALIIKSEEERFLDTLEAGMARWQEVVTKYRSVRVVPGPEVFRLHDTYGFHVELTRELAAEQGLELDTAGFEQAMQEQKERSKKTTFIAPALSLKEAATCGQSFCGYVQDETETTIVHLTPLAQGEPGAKPATENAKRGSRSAELPTPESAVPRSAVSVSSLPSGQSPGFPGEFEVVLEAVPFYAAAGGQIGDTGRIIGDEFELEVLDTYYSQQLRVCRARVISGEPRVGARVKARVDQRRRREIERAHTATHLLHAALRCTLGDYVRQEGSAVEPGRLRFDFVAFEPLTPEQLATVEQLVYQRILDDLPVEALRDLPIDEARKLGALAFFGENYGALVNVIKVGDFSLEFCGGTHLRRTGEIGLMKIRAESGIAAGIRRIEALVGEQAFAEIAGYRRVLDELNAALNVKEELLPERVNELTRTVKGLESRVTSLSARLAESLAEELAETADTTGEVRVITGSFDFLELPELRLLADAIRRRLNQKTVGLLISAPGAEIRFLVFATADLKASLPAGRLAREVGKALGGGGGGRPDLAEGGGRKENIAAGVAEFKRLLAASY